MNPKPKKFGDIEKGDKLYYIDISLRTVEPCYVMGTYYEEGKPDVVNITVLIVPKDLREKPLEGLDTSNLVRLVFQLPKNSEEALVGTIPPTIYSPNEQYLQSWLKFH